MKMQAFAGSNCTQATDSMNQAASAAVCNRARYAMDAIMVSVVLFSIAHLLLDVVSISVVISIILLIGLIVESKTKSESRTN